MGNKRCQILAASLLKYQQGDLQQCQLWKKGGLSPVWHLVLSKLTCHKRVSPQGNHNLGKLKANNENLGLEFNLNRKEFPLLTAQCLHVTRRINVGRRESSQLVPWINHAKSLKLFGAMLESITPSHIKLLNTQSLNESHLFPIYHFHCPSKVLWRVSSNSLVNSSADSLTVFKNHLCCNLRWWNWHSQIKGSR
jgi:hypothetical protein